MDAILFHKRRSAMMPNEPRSTAALSPQLDDDTQSLVAGVVTLEALLQIPAQAKSAFESLRGLSNHLSETFGARLVFVSCRDKTAPHSPEFLFDTARSAFAAERARLFGLELPLDAAIAMTGRPLRWRPASLMTSILDTAANQAATPAATRDGVLIAIPYQCGPLIALCAVQPVLDTAQGIESSELLAWHCIQFLPEHFRHHPLRKRPRAPLLSPQEERIILQCAAGLTDKEIGRDLEISPHTVRTHINSAKAKLGARNKTHAVTLYKELSVRT
ncbi:MAG: helix-turn-helix transcriptional regulator [Alphaproteobacteria bacterium]|nr:helix-turn-helix transcriptional regulator [Alphaproteobacteria bacterium]